MKRSFSNLFFVVLSLFALLLAACTAPSTDITTKINRDGSIDKTIKCKVARESKFAGEHLLRGVGYWLRVDYKVDSATEDRVFSKHFENIFELQKSFLPATDSTIGIEAKFSKKFKWFYTYYSYSETYKAHPLFAGLSTAGYIRPEHLAILHCADSSKMVKDSIEKIVRKGFDSLFNVAVNRMVRKGMAAYPDSIALHSHCPSFTEKLITALPSFSSSSGERIENEIDTFLNKNCNSYPPRKIKPFLKNEILRWNRVVEMFMAVSIPVINNKIELPGSEITSNAVDKGFSSFSWPISFYDHFSDYEMKVETREINMGLFLLTIIAGFVWLIFGAMYMVKRQRR